MIDHIIWGIASRSPVRLQAKINNGVVFERQFDFEEWQPRHDLIVVQSPQRENPFTWPKKLPLDLNGFKRVVLKQ